MNETARSIPRSALLEGGRDAKWVIGLAAAGILTTSAFGAITRPGPAYAAGSPAIAPTSRDWEFVRGGFKGAFALHALGPDNVWGAGRGGVFRYDGDAWRVVLELGEIGADGIRMYDAQAGWIWGGPELPGPIHYRRGEVEYVELAELVPEIGRHERMGSVTDIHLLGGNGDSGGWGLVPLWSPDDVLTLPEATAVIRLSGGRWRDTGVRLRGWYTAVDGTRDDDIWVVGEGLAHYDGTAWSRAEESDVLVELWRSWGGRCCLWDVEMLSSDHGWAVGSDGVIMRYDGRDWNLMRSGRVYSLYSVSVRSERDAIAVGAFCTAVRYDGQTWLDLPHGCRTPGFADNYAVEHVPDSDDVYVAMGGPVGGLILRLLDDTLEVVHGDSVFEIEMLSPTQGWAATSDAILRFDGRGWREMLKVPRGVSSWEDLSAPADNDVWVLTGWSAQVEYDGRLFHWDGSSWREVPSPRNYRLTRITMLGGENGWGLGVGPRCDNTCTDEQYILRYDQRGWRSVYGPVAPTKRQWYIQPTPDGHVWTAGYYALFHFDGCAWTEQHIPGGPGGALSIKMFSGFQGWALSSGDTAVRLDGGIWTVTYGRSELGESPTKDVLYAVDLDDVWWLSDNSDAMHWDGRSWRLVRQFSREFGWFRDNAWGMLDLDVIQLGNGERELWVAGASETIIRHRYRPVTLQRDVGAFLPAVWVQGPEVGRPCENAAVERPLMASRSDHEATMGEKIPDRELRVEAVATTARMEASAPVSGSLPVSHSGHDAGPE